MKNTTKAFYPGRISRLLLGVGIAAGASFLPMAHAEKAGGGTSFALDETAGEWRVNSGPESLSGLATTVNGRNILKGAKLTTAEGKTVAESQSDGLAVRAEWNVLNGRWVELRLSIKNVSKEVRPLESVEFFSANLSSALKGTESDKLRFYHLSENMWRGTGISSLAEEPLSTAYYVGCLFTPGHPAAWMVGFRPPQLWGSVIQADSKNQRLKASVELAVPFPIDPGEEIHFDSLVLSAEYPLVDGLLAFGKFYTPRQPASAARKFAAYNTWEAYRGKLSSKTLLPALSFLSNWKPAREDMPFFVLDEGWAMGRGVWTFDPKKFPEGSEGWVKKVKEAGFEPGIWLSPFFTNNEGAKAAGVELLPPLASSIPQRAVFDPSDPKVQKYLFEQIAALRKAGYRYFKMDFLRNAYRPLKGYRHSKWPAEKVMREFFIGMRKAMGEDSYWLACNSSTAACSEIADGSRIGNDVGANWGHITNRIAPNVALLFWMHGNAWLNDPDFLVVSGPETLNPEGLKHFSELHGSKKTHFTIREATTWASLIVISGGVVTWSDATDMRPEGLKIVETALEHGGGERGIPLDLENGVLAEKWVRREKDRMYVGLFNWGNEAGVRTVDASEIPELAKMREGQDIFTGKTLQVVDGKLSVELPPHASACILLKSQ